MNVFSFPGRLARRLRTAYTTLKVDGRTLQRAWAVSRQAVVRKDRRPVIFFNASTRIRGQSLNAAFSLVTSWALRLQGVPVIHFVCKRGMSLCLQGTDQENVHRGMPCGLCLRQSFFNYAASTRVDFGFKRASLPVDRLMSLDIPALMQYEHPFEDTLFPVGALVLPSVRWRLRRFSLPEDEPTRFLYREFILSALNVVNEFKQLLDSVEQPQAVVVFNGQTFPEAAVRWLALKRGLRVITHEVSLPPLSAFFTDGEATAWPMPMGAEFQLDTEMDARLDALMQNRFEGKFSMAGIRFFPQIQGLSQNFLQKAAGFGQIVPVFTNVIFDTSQQHSNAFFPHMFAWLETLLEVIRRHPETLFVIRAHPDETRPGKASRETVAMWVERTGVAKLPNVIFVPPEEYISSYELIRRSKFSLIYNSTVGLEASIMGQPVLAAGRTRSTDFDTMYSPPDREAYLKQLEAFLQAETVAAAPEHIRNARRFFYFHYFIASLPFGDYIEPASLRGFVKWKRFDLNALSPSTSPTIRALSAGILNNGDFLLKGG